MGNLIERWWRVSGVAIAMIGLGLVGASPVAAEEICRPNPGLGFVDVNGDGLVSQGEVQAFINAAGDAPGIEDLRAVVNNWPANLTGIRYAGCTPDDGGTGSNGGGTGNDGGGTGNNGGGTGNEGGGTGNNGGAGDGSGSGTGTNGTNNPTTIVVIDGTPVVVDSVTGLPATGQGAVSASSMLGISSIAVFGIVAVALASAGVLFGWSRRSS